MLAKAAVYGYVNSRLFDLPLSEVRDIEEDAYDRLVTEYIAGRFPRDKNQVRRFAHRIASIAVSDWFRRHKPLPLKEDPEVPPQRDSLRSLEAQDEAQRLIVLVERACLDSRDRAIMKAISTGHHTVPELVQQLGLSKAAIAARRRGLATRVEALLRTRASAMPLGATSRESGRKGRGMQTDEEADLLLGKSKTAQDDDVAHEMVARLRGLNTALGSLRDTIEAAAHRLADSRSR